MAKVDPALSHLLESRSASPVEVVVRLRAEGDAIADSPNRARAVAQRVLDRVTELAHERPADYNIFPSLQSMVVVASPDFVAQLIEQPEVAAALPNRA